MSSLESLVSLLESKDIGITVDGNRLRINAPAGALTAEIKTELKTRKAELLAYFGNRHDTIKPVPRDQDLPLSFAQQRLWLLDKLYPENPVYNIAEMLYLSGALDINALQQGLAEIIRRHEALRTLFPEKNGQAVQQVLPAAEFELPLVMLTGNTDSERDMELEKLALETARQPFQLDKGPLFRAILVKPGESRHVLILVMHHIIFDGWSFGVFYRELVELYAAFKTATPAPLVPLPIQYADFACWQRDHLQGELLESQLSYWKERLADAPAGLELPASRPRPGQLSFQGTRITRPLSDKLIDTLVKLGRQAGVTLYMTLLSAFLVLLYRYTDRHDIVIGTPIAGRNRVETEPLTGFFVNTLVLRNDLSGNPVFTDLLARVRETTLGAYTHQDVPLEMLVEELQPERDLSRTPFFQLMFAFQGADPGQIDLPGLRTKRQMIDLNTSKFDLTVSIEKTHEGHTTAWEFATELFDRRALENMQAHYLMLLEAIAGNPDLPIQDYPLLTDQEKNQQLFDWNDTGKSWPLTTTLHQLFEEQSDRTPTATAVVFEEEQLSYAELNSRANKLARYLQELGTGTEALVGICAERSLDMVVGLLGILKAGAAYVPLDPDYPGDRLSYMLEDAHIDVLLTQSHLLERLPQYNGKTIQLDRDWPEINLLDELCPEAESIPADALAYMIYTSGSTGKPKGVMISHRGICNRLFWMQDEYRLTEKDSVLQKTSFSFDVSVWEFFWPLMTGARLVLARPGGHRDNNYLAGLIARKHITVLHFVPSMLQVFLEGETGNCPSLRHVICSGEALSCETLQRFFSRLDANLHNLYGPTEAAVDVSSWQCHSDSHCRTVPIGHPIANTRLYILDKQRQPVPTGVSGELYIAGTGLSRGYRNKPGLTAAVFVPDPFSQEPGQRMYRTGDLARFRIDGAIEYLGRVDHQVKLRGFRIELGEIETRLAAHAGIREALVIAREDTTGDPRLVAYTIPADNSIAVAELRQWLGKTLPDYMIPAAFVSLDAFPLTPNGKTDRRALPAPDSRPPGLDKNNATEYVQPKDTLEYQLSEIWGEIFNTVWPLAINSNFFNIGGHSLMAVRLIAQIKSVLDYELPLASLFQAPTIAEQAEVIRAGRNAVEWSPVVKLQASDKSEPVFLMHLLDGIIFQMHLQMARLLGKYGPVYGIQACGIDGREKPQTSFREIAATYLEAIFRVQPEGPYRLIGICDGATVIYEMAQQLRAAGKEIGLLAFVVPSGPPLQVKPPRPQHMNYEGELKIHPPELKKIIDAQFLARFTYYPQPYAGNLLYIEAADDPETLSQPTLLAWQQLIRGHMNVITVPGNHNSAIRDPRVKVLIEELGKYL